MSSRVRVPPANALLAGHESKDRIARNEAIFGAINERVE
jgi:hypothetical protein